MNKEQIENIINATSSLSQAAHHCGMAFSTFKRKCHKLNIQWNPKQSHKGIKTGPHKDRIKTEDILAGKFPHYQTYKLKIRLIDEGYKKDECEKCGWKQKVENQKYTPCELDHINGNSEDHRLENLILLCPNCHSLTNTYRFRRGKTNEQLYRNI